VVRKSKNKNEAATSVAGFDTCPTCENGILEFDKGHSATKTEPGQPAECFCPNCGDTFSVDWERQEKRELANQIARELFTNGQGNVAARLVLMSEHQQNLGGWSEVALQDRIFEALVGKKNDRP